MVAATVLGPELIFATGLVKFVAAVARLVCLDLLGWCSSRFANTNSGPRTCLLRPYLSIAGHPVGGLRGHHPGVPTQLEPRRPQHIRQREGGARVAGVVLLFGEVEVPVAEISCVNGITKPRIQSYEHACRTPRRGGGSSSPRSPGPGTRDRSPGISEVKKTSCFE